tara:strand:+ start:75 stop:902 length:828 start_codon:yes stop_codon:yes gene_type:complete
MASENDPLERALAEIDAEAGDTSSEPKRFGLVPIVVLTFVSLAFGGLVWYAYDAGVRAGSEDAAPLLKMSGPIKVPPPKPGGVTVAHQEKTIFNPVQGSRKDREVERILPPPEKPLSPMNAAPPPPKLPSITGKRTRQRAPDISDVKTKQTKLIRPPVTPKNKKAPTKLTPIDPSRTRKAKTKRRQKVSGPSGGAFLIQTGALATPKNAEREWAKIKKRYSDVVGRLQLKVSRAVVRGKVYYRLRAGPINSRQKAIGICKTLKSQGQGCIVVRTR